MPQEFRNTIPAYARGRRANMEDWNTISRTKEGSATLAFGAPVMPGTGANTCVILDATTGRNVLGITEASVVLPASAAATVDAYRQYDSVAICEAGVIGVLLGANVTAGAQSRFNTADGTWTGAAQSATVVTVPGAQFEAAGTSGDIGVVRYRRPVPSLSVSG